MKLSKKEMKNIKAGASAAWLSSVLRGVNIFADLGRYLGSSIRRLADRKYCSY